MDFSKLHNPFDFANPVIDPKLFAGRKSELEDIEYYLNHAKSAPRAINLALIGDRASGKTSLLNMIEAGAKQRGFCTVRIDLDESDVETQLVFFLKLFDGILTAACREGAFGGIQGKTYDTYRSMIDAYEIPEDRTFCSFVFPMQYAKAMGNGNNVAPVSDVYKEDISLIHAELKKPIAILVDECDVLTHSRVHLEKLRNLFMNISGFFLVFTGTGAFFPLINDVFSPIIRQFKKINVKPFEHQDETKDCVEKPLKGLGIRTKDIFDFETLSEIAAIHNLSGGRPYEIQLICHQLFKRVQQGLALKLKLSIDVLDDVLAELQSLQDVDIRPVVQKIRELSKEELSALNVLLFSNNHLTFDQALYLEILFNINTEWTKETLKNKLDDLLSKGLIKIENGILGFAGDDFDKLYCKYYSRKQDVIISINELPFSVRLRIGIDIFVRRQVPNFQLNDVYGESLTESELGEYLIDFGNLNFGFIEKNVALADILYRANAQNQDLKEFPFICVTIKTPWDRLQAWYMIDELQNEYPADVYIGEFERIFRHIRENSQELKTEVSIKVFLVSVVPLESVASKVVLINNQKLKSGISDFHFMEMYECYTELQDSDGARYHGELALQFQPEPEDPSFANNLGYLFISIGEHDKALPLLETAEKQLKSIPDGLPSAIVDFWGGTDSLVHYNLGIVYAMKNEYDKALELMHKSIEEAQKREDNECACLFVPEIVDNHLMFREVFNPDLLETAKSSMTIIGSYLGMESARWAIE